MNNMCDTTPIKNNIECNCDYVTPKIEKFLIRKTKNGYQVKVNGKGKWLGATYDEETKTLSYSL